MAGGWKVSTCGMPAGRQAAEMARVLAPWRSQASSLLERVVVRYRPAICPYGELLSMLPAGKRYFDFGFGRGLFLADATAGLSGSSSSAVAVRIEGTAPKMRSG